MRLLFKSKQQDTKLPPANPAAWAEDERIPTPLQISRFDHTWKALALPLLLFISLPLLALILRVSLIDLMSSLRQPEVFQAVRLSLNTSLLTTLTALIFGTPVAYLLAQANLRLRQFIDTLVDLPTVLPPAVAGVALLMAFGRRGLFGETLADMGVNIPFTPLAVIMAQTFIAAPLYIKAASIGYASVNTELRQAAELDGANSWQVFRYVILPLSWLPMVTGSAMTWARAMGEFGATIIFAGNFPGRTQTMPLAIYLGFEIDLDVALALSFILITFSFAILILIKGLLHQRLAPNFR